MKYRGIIQLTLLALILACGLLLACDSGSDDDDNDDVASDDDDNRPDDDDSGDDDDDDDLFPPEEQTPLYEKGLILPEDSLECYPVGAPPQLNCNHHASAVAELPDGTVAAVWYHGEREKSVDSRIVWSRLAPGETAWSWPEILFDDPDRSEGNPTLWVHENGSLYLFFATIYGEGWNEARVRMITSTDGKNWTAPVLLREEACWNARHRPARLINGDLLLPLYNECLAYPVYIRSTDDFITWTQEPHNEPGYFLGHLGQIQPALIILDNGVIAAITRDGFPTNRIGRTISLDQGLTWSDTVKLTLPNSGTGIDQVRLLDGHVVVVFNDSPEVRFPLTVALSHDGGETYLAQRDINNECEAGGCQYHYPSILQSQIDGTIWVTYTHERRTIGWVHFNEAWLIEQE